MPRNNTATHVFTAPEKRLTPELTAQLEALAPLFVIQVTHLGKQGTELSGAGFSEGQTLRLPTELAKVRLLSEICSILARWVPFNLWEPCEITLFAVPPQRIERCAFNWRKQLSQQAKHAARERAAAALAALPMNEPSAEPQQAWVAPVPDSVGS